MEDFNQTINANVVLTSLGVFFYPGTSFLVLKTNFECTWSWVFAAKTGEACAAVDDSIQTFIVLVLFCLIGGIFMQTRIYIIL